MKDNLIERLRELEGGGMEALMSQIGIEERTGGVSFDEVRGLASSDLGTVSASYFSPSLRKAIVLDSDVAVPETIEGLATLVCELNDEAQAIEFRVSSALNSDEELIISE